MDKKQNSHLKVAKKSLQETMQQGEPTVENLMFALNKSEATIKQLRMQLGQAAEAYKDVQLRLSLTEFHNRLEFLWKVMFTDGSASLFGRDFITKCAEEFKEMMFPPLAEPKDEKQQEENV